MVEVFKTNVQYEKQALALEAALLRRLPHFTISFDLDDCDKILRVKGQDILPNKIIEVLRINGYQCQVLD